MSARNSDNDRIKRARESHVIRTGNAIKWRVDQHKNANTYVIEIAV